MGRQQTKVQFLDVDSFVPAIQREETEDKVEKKREE